MDLQDGDWLSRQPEDARKGFAAPVFLRWASSLASGGIESEYTLMMVNDRVNLHADIIMGHPDLMFRLAATCGLGKKKRHEWIAGPKRKSANNPARALLEQVHPLAALDEIDLLMTLYTEVEFEDLANGSGLPTDETKAAVKAFRQDRASVPAAQSTKKRSG